MPSLDLTGGAGGAAGPATSGANVGPVIFGSVSTGSGLTARTWLILAAVGAAILWFVYGWRRR